MYGWIICLYPSITLVTPPLQGLLHINYPTTGGPERFWPSLTSFSIRRQGSVFWKSNGPFRQNLWEPIGPDVAVLGCQCDYLCQVWGQHSEKQMKICLVRGTINIQHLSHLSKCMLLQFSKVNCSSIHLPSLPKSLFVWKKLWFVERGKFTFKYLEMFLLSEVSERKSTQKNGDFCLFILIPSFPPKENKVFIMLILSFLFSFWDY